MARVCGSFSFRLPRERIAASMSTTDAIAASGEYGR
jgi:hypothetical protein